MKKLISLLTILLTGATSIAWTAPSVSSHSPSKNQLNINSSTNISITFSESMNEATLTSSNIKVSGISSGIHSGSISYDAGSFTATFNPDDDFFAGEIVTVTVTTGIKNASNASLSTAYSWTFTTKSLPSGDSYSTDSTYASANLPNGIIAADLDGDGDIDISVSNQNSNNVSVLKNNGDGTFATKIDYSTGISPFDITAADVDNDNDVDIISVNNSGSSLSVLKNNGDGTFAAKIDYTVASGPSFAFASDIDGDGYVDLISAGNSVNKLSVLKNNGDGTFAPKVDYDCGAGPYGIIAADVDNDGDMDMVSSNSASDNISVLMNNGDGTFAAKVDYGVGDQPRILTTGDIDGDGDLDVITGNENSDNISVLKNNGNGTFAAKVDYISGDGAWAPSAIDVDGDGDVDIVCANSNANNFSVLKNDGTGAFGEKSDYTAGSTPYAATAADLDGDGDMDYIAANAGTSTITIVLNIATSPTLIETNPEANAPNISPSSDIQITFNKAILSDSLNLRTIKVSGSQTGIHNGSISYNAETFTATFNSDVDFFAGEEVTVTVTKGVKSTFNAVLASSYTWKFTIASSTTGDREFAEKINYSVNAAPVDVFAADFDKDGNVDLVVSSNSTDSVSVLMGNGDGTFANKVSYYIGSLSLAVIVSDVDGDGNLDIISSKNVAFISVLLGNGDGTFDSYVDYPVWSGITGIISTDLDGDGDNDLVSSNYFFKSITILKNNGGDNFSGSDYSTGNGSPFSLYSSDINNDGYLDIVTPEYNLDSVSVIINNGDGTFKQVVNYLTGSSPSSVTVLEVNGDGNPDLVVTNSGSNSISLLINNGNGTFASKVDYQTGPVPFKVTSADFDGDGNQDLIVTDSGVDSVSVLRGLGDGTFASRVNYQTGSGPYGVVSADVDGDGDLDIITANSNDASISVLKNISALSITSHTPIQHQLNVSSSSNISVTFSESVDQATLTSSNIKVSGNSSGIHNGSFSYDAETFTATFNPDNDFFAGEVVTVTVTTEVKSSVNAALFSPSTWEFTTATTATGNRTFAEKTDYATEASPAGLFAADLNKDGNMDLVVASNGSDSVSVFIGNGDGTFQGKVNYALDIQAISVTASDVNGDGNLDLICTLVGGISTSVFLGNGDGTFSGKVDYTIGAGLDLVVTDLDGDGDNDFSTTLTSEKVVSVSKNDGNGVFSDPYFLLTGNTSPIGLTSSDVNGDGYPDLISAEFSVDTISVFINKGDGTFESKVDYLTGDTPYGITAKDFNGDGSADLAVVNAGSNSVSVFLNIGNGTFSSKVDYQTGTAPGFINSGDIDGDGNQDLAVGNINTDSISVFMGHGDGTFSAKIDYQVGSSPYRVILSDVDGDGDLDVITANYASGTISILKNISAEPTSSSSNISFSSVSETGFTINWTNGDGSNRIVLVKQGNAVNGTPSDNSTYSANTAFGSGSQIGSGNYVVYNGTESSVSVTGLSGGKTYHVAIFEYNGSAGDENYLTDSFAAGNQATISPATYSNGTLDSGFGNSGYVTTPLGSSDAALGIAIQPDNYAVTVGWSQTNFAAVRYDDSGNLDDNFSGDGKVLTDVGAQFSVLANRVAIQSDGKIVVVGTLEGDIVLVRYNTDASLDNGFGTNGIVKTDINSGSDDGGDDVAIQSDGKIVVVGYSNGNYAVVRYTTSGGLDSGFGTNGVVTTDFGGYDIANGVAIQSDGKIVVAGGGDSGDFSPAFTIARYTTSGGLDSGFGTGGKALFYFGGFLFDAASDVALLSDGKIVMTGYATDNGDVGMICLNENGSPYSGFNGTGMVSTELGNDEQPRAIAVQNDDRIVVVGTSNNEIMALRYKTDGSLDDTFGSGNGYVLIPAGETFAGATDVAIQFDNKIIMAVNINAQFGIMRLAGDDGTLPVELASFSGYESNGKVMLNWETKTETNNYGWEIENRESGELNGEWKKMGFVSGKGTTMEKQNYSYSVFNLLGSKAEFRLKQIDVDGKFTYSNVLSIELKPVEFSLSQNYPNPFNPTTTIRYALASSAPVELTIYNVLGQKVKTLVSEVQSTGFYSVNLDGNSLTSGTYFYVLNAGTFHSVKKLTMMK